MSSAEAIEPGAPQARYEIQKLLDHAVQPFDAYTEEQLDALAAGIGRRRADPLAVPVVLSSDGILVDGSQRLRALQKLGRKYIAATDVRIVPQINAGNALEWSVRIQMQRRHSDIAAKALAVRQLMAKNGWSQERCAKIFGVSGAAVSLWLRDTPADPDQPISDYVVGEDGVVQDVSAKRRKARLERPQHHPWVAGGECFRMARSMSARMYGATHELRSQLKELSPEEKDAAIAVVQDLVGQGQEFLAALEED